MVVDSDSTIFFGGSIVTVDESAPEVEALAIRDGRIVALGDLKRVLQFHSPGTTMVDLQGGALLPGFIDPHVHLAWTSYVKHHCADLSGFDTAQGTQIIDVLRVAAATNTSDEAVLAFGYGRQCARRDAPRLKADDLDQASNRKPVIVLDQSCEVARANHAALQLAGITSNSDSPRGIEYVRSPSGMLTGEVRGGQPLLPFQHLIPRIDFSQKLRESRSTLHDWAHRGCTTVYDAAVGAAWGREEVRLLLMLASESATPVRLRAAFLPNDLARDVGITSRQGNDRLCFVGMNLAVDGPQPGVHGERLENLESPNYRVPSNEGLHYDDEELKALMQAWHSANWQLVIHVSSPAAIDQSLRVLGAILKESPERKHRHRLDCRHTIDNRQLALAADLALSVSHPAHPQCDRRQSDDFNPGPSVPEILSLGAELRNHLVSSLNSDSPIMEVHPLQSLQTAVTSLLAVERPAFESEARAVDQALKTITANPAHQCFLDDKVGTLEVGKLADLVILSRNPRTTSSSRIAEIEVLQTYLEGAPQRTDAPIPRISLANP